jgi:hypothetical protein
MLIIVRHPGGLKVELRCVVCAQRLTLAVAWLASVPPCHGKAGKGAGCTSRAWMAS